jgi:hypothetical protein
MPDYAALKAELQKPAYVGKTDVEAVAMLGAPGTSIARPRGVVSAYQVVNVLDPTEFAALTSPQLQRIQIRLSPGQVDLRDDNTRGNLANIFPNATAPVTRGNLVALRTETIPRTIGEEVFGVIPAPADVAYARSL